MSTYSLGKFFFRGCVCLFFKKFVQMVSTLSLYGKVRFFGA